MKSGFSFASVITLIASAASVAQAAVVPTRAPETTVLVSAAGNLGTIKGVVRDAAGNPIADATVAIFRLGTSQLLKQVNSSANGRFLAKIAPGTYTVLAVAQGFNPVTLSDVQVGKAAELNYGFRLERAGQGNTLPEKRLDRNSSKWRIRAAQIGRSIYQNQEGDAPDENTAENVPDAESERSAGRASSVVETFVAGRADGNFAGLNFATSLPLDDLEVSFAGQFSTGSAGPQRLESGFKFKASENHQVRIFGGVGSLGTVIGPSGENSLGQLSLQATDEWRVREGLIVVYGLDYSKFFGAGGEGSITPRLGLQFDLDARTRFRAAYTSPADDRTWASAIEYEGSDFLFADPVAIADIMTEDGRPILNRSQRLEFGIERILDNQSSIEANVFLDTTFSRGVGLTAMPFDTLAASDDLDAFVVNQSGRARGARIVYNRRLSGIFSTAVGYSLGQGQQLSPDAVSSPANAFEDAIFHSYFGQLSADLRSGTSVRTVFRFSPQATVFAIDPFKGRLAIYDPGLSVLITQSLPTLGLPFRAQAIVDARNVFDSQRAVSGGAGTLSLTGQRRMLRGGISVRF